MAETSYPLADCRERLAVVRTAVLKCWPFLSAALMRLVVRFDDRVPTAGVDPWWRLYLNPKFFMELTPGQGAVLLAGHELQHLLLDHPNRCPQYRGQNLVDGDGNPVDLVNVANDLAINSSLKTWVSAAAAYLDAERSPRKVPLDVPPGAVYPENFRSKDGGVFPSGLVSEQYCELLLALPPSPKGGDKGKGAGGADKGSGRGAGGSPCKDPGCGSGAGGRRGEWEDRSEPDPADPTTGTSSAVQEVVRQQVAKAAVEQSQKVRGSVPSGVETWAKVRIAPPKVNWRRELRHEIRSAVNWVMGQTDYTFRRRNRRQNGAVILAGMHHPLPKIAVVLDTSGSMGGPDSQDYRNAFSEIAGILKTCGMPAVPVIPADAAAYDVQWVSAIDQVKIVGGGGTDMPTGIRSAVRLCKPRLIVNLTDGETGWAIQQSEVRGARVVVVLTSPSRVKPPGWMRVVPAFAR